MLLNLSATDTNLLTDHTLVPKFENESLWCPDMLLLHGWRKGTPEIVQSPLPWGRTTLRLSKEIAFFLKFPQRRDSVTSLSTVPSVSEMLAFPEES